MKTQQRRLINKLKMVLSLNSNICHAELCSYAIDSRK